MQEDQNFTNKKQGEQPRTCISENHFSKLLFVQKVEKTPPAVHVQSETILQNEWSLINGR